MNKIKITGEDWTYIGKYNYAAKWCRFMCSYSLIKKDDKTFERVQNINLFAFCLIFIPLHIIQALVCMWDGGLKEFIIFERKLGTDTLQKGNPAFERAEEIWNSKTADL